ncbi:MAG: arsenical-resistance protein, partial [Cyanobacteria bacterium P01_D01_bin.73]
MAKKAERSPENPVEALPKTAVQAGGKLNIFERYLTFWVICCTVAGIGLGRVFPDLAIALDAMSVHQVSIPVAICLFFMMYPIMVKIDFAQAGKAARSPKPVLLTLIVNWMITPFTMVLLAQVFLGLWLRPFLTGTEILNGSM